MTNGWIKNGKLCGFGNSQSGSYVSGFGYLERNVVTGEVYSSDVVSYSVVPMARSFSSAMLNKENDKIYGYGSYSGSMAFKSCASDGAFRNTEILFELTDPFEWCPAVCVDPETGQMYGISLGQNESQLLSIDDEGFSDVIATLPVQSAKTVSALAYFPATGYFLWSNNSADGVSAVYAIKDDGSSCEKVLELSDKTHFNFFVTGEEAQGKGVPEAAVMKSFDFTAPATSGSIVYTLPTKDITGADLSGDLTWTATLDGATYTTGTAAPGADVTVQYTDVEQGKRTFGFYVSKGDLESGKVSDTQYIGYDRPVGTAKVTLTLVGDKTIKAEWEPVTTGVNGGYVDAQAVEYKVFLNDNLMTTTSETTWEGTVDPEGELTANIVSIVAVAHEMESKAVNSNSVVVGAPLVPEVFIAPTRAEADLMTYPEYHGTYWYYDDEMDPAVFSLSTSYGDYGPLDTWLILPPIDFNDQGGIYSISFEHGTYLSYCIEYFEVWAGQAPNAEAMTTQIMQKTQAEKSDFYDPKFKESTSSFSLPNPGVWYIGIRGVTEDDYMGIMVRNIAVKLIQSGIESSFVDGEGVINGVAGGIEYRGLNDARIDVYSLSGVKSASRVANGDGRIELPAGIYVVRSGNTVKKVAVK